MTCRESCRLLYVVVWFGVYVVVHARMHAMLSALASRDQLLRGTKHSGRCNELTRFADFLLLDPGSLVAEFRELRVVADRVRQMSCSNASAWAAAFEDTQATAKRKTLGATCCPPCGCMWSILPLVWNSVSKNGN